jgi:hypothetical protein
MYQVFIERKVIKFLEKISEPDYSKIKLSILRLAKYPRPSGCKKLKGRLASGKVTTELFTKYLIRPLKLTSLRLGTEAMFTILKKIHNEKSAGGTTYDR